MANVQPYFFLVTMLICGQQKMFTEGRVTPMLKKDDLLSYVKNPDEIQEYDMILPTVDNRGRYRRSADNRHATQVTFTAFGEDFHLDLIPTERFFSPDLLVEYIHEDGSVTKKPIEVDDCFYNGHVISHNSSGAAISLCNGVMQGLITNGNDNIYITPLTEEHVDTYASRSKRNSEWMHLIYKRNVDDRPFCGVEPTQSKTGTSPLSAGISQSIEQSYIPPKYVELFIILDVDFVSNRSPEHEQFAMTLLNVVSRRCTDPSLDFSWRLYIVRMMVLSADTVTVDSGSFTISNIAQNSIDSVRSWGLQANPSSDTDPAHWDNILILTGKDLLRTDGSDSLLGLAFTAGTCHQEQYGVSINEDVGLSTGIVASHELGHTLTLEHDEDEGCASGFIMGTSITAGPSLFSWSNCSRMNLKTYFRWLPGNSPSECLNDIPQASAAPLATLELPGRSFSIADQCALLGNGPCTFLPVNCAALICDNGAGGCTTFGSLITAEGTPCSSGTVNTGICLAGQCVSESTVPAPVNGGWSDWTESPCSRTCGGGIISRQRVCNNPSPIWGGMPCQGEGAEIRLCNIDVACSNSPDDYRNEQCTATASLPDQDGQIYGWTLFFPPSSRSSYCQNPCLRSVGNIYALRPPGQNEDGTECWDYTQDDANIILRCAGGSCQAFGCDGFQNSGKVFDVCRICNGNGFSCSPVTGTTAPSGALGVFNFFHQIPVGATSIVITNSNVQNGNHIAITGAGGTEYFRGNGPFASQSTRGSLSNFIITHNVQTTDEVFRSTGPSIESLSLQVYLTSPIQTPITYEYYLPKTETTYFWDICAWSSCSATCQESRVITCSSVQGGAKTTVADNLCEGNVGAKPQTTRTCSTNACAGWVVTQIGACNVQCGVGIQIQTVECTLNGMVVADTQCDAATRPSAVQNCDMGNCDWSVGPFGACSVTCGTGTRNRTVVCMNNVGTVADINCDISTKPVTTTTCILSPCVVGSPMWVADMFGPCSVICGIGFQSRSVTCELNGSQVDITQCDAATRPSSLQTCDMGSCDWSIGPFGDCSVTCGTGTRNRTVVCMNNEGIVADSNCATVKPATSSTCMLSPCDSTTPMWSIDSQFGLCSSVCGTGVQSRNVTCRENGAVVQDSMCDVNLKPSTEISCNAQNCDWVVSEYGLCSRTCGVGLRRRTVLCNNGFGVTVDEQNCPLPKPEETMVCNEPCIRPTWVIASAFTECSTKCGKGFQTRDVYCRVGLENVDDTFCEGQGMPVRRQICISLKCILDKNCDILPINNPFV